MSIAASAISAVLKSVVGDKLGDGLIKELSDISIREISDKGINEIINFINRGKSDIERIFSEKYLKYLNIPEEDIDYVAAEIRDLLLDIEVTDETIKQCGYGTINLSDFLWSEYCKRRGNFIESESYIKRCLFAVADTLIALILKSEDFEKDVLKQVSISSGDTYAEVQKISDYLKENYSKLDLNLRIVLDMMQKVLEYVKEDKESDFAPKLKFLNNKKEKYIESWNSRLFLHVENDKNPLTLADSFVMPDCGKFTLTPKMNFLYKDSFDKVIDKFIKYNGTSTMLIVGEPGIGKSTITSWIANEYQNDDRIIILRFRDWESEELKKGLLQAVCNILECEKNDLECKVLLLDGYDEMKSLANREAILNSFLNAVRDFDNFKCIITSRPAYIDARRFQNIIELEAFNIGKIEDFYQIITGKSLEKKELLNLEVLGIPVILYIAIMSNVEVEQVNSKFELYNLIFSENGGLFDKFSGRGNGYSNGAHILSDPDNIEKYLNFLQDVAYKMYKKNSLVLRRGDCEIPQLEFQGNNVSILEFPIKHLFEETENNIEFVHKTMYEFFVSEHFFKVIRDIIHSAKTTEELTGKLGYWMIEDKEVLPIEIYDFLQYKVNMKLRKEFNIILDAFQLMLNDGMTYHIGKPYKNVIDCELKIFANMLEFLHLWKYQLSDVKLSKASDFIKYNRKFVYNFEGMNLKGLDLENASLANSNLSEASLENANLSGADMRGANLKNAKLSGSHLDNSIWTEEDLEIIMPQLEMANFTCIVIRKQNEQEIKYRDEIFFNERSLISKLKSRLFI